jgi:hypothetical protein
MAEPKKSSGPKPDPVVEKLVRDPARPGTKLLSGYLGKSARQGYWRIYLNFEFSEYLEVAEGDILHSERLGGDDSTASGSWVWVKEDARLEHVKTRGQQAQAEFLRGDIAAVFLAQTAVRSSVFGLVTIAALPRTFSVTECATCPTDDGGHTCFPAVCTLATSCFTTVPVDVGCGRKIAL